MENITLGIPAGNNWNNEQAMDSIYRLSHFAEILPGEIISSHDISIWETLKKSPDAYR
ncbi:MAG: hypothetical protein JRF65_13595 [Deltaproteobacteria bacterium]|nr:hypothetical protein [Deltaproteobacteria bacterium]